MSEEAAEKIGMGLAWFGFWLMIGLANFGEHHISIRLDENSRTLIEQAIEQFDSDETRSL